jgi:hypothetical protein
MGNDGHSLTLWLLMHEKAAHGHQFGAAIAANDSRFTKESIDGGIWTSEGTGMRGGGPAAGFGCTSLDSGNPASFVDQRGSVLQKFRRVTDAFHIQ